MGAMLISSPPQLLTDRNWMIGLKMIKNRGLSPIILNYCQKQQEQKQWKLDLLSIIVSLMLFATGSQLYAEEQPLAKKFDFNQQIERLKNAKKVILLMNRPYARYINDPIPRVSHKAFSCQYISQKNSGIQRLAQILKLSNLKQVPAIEAHLPIVGASIYFTFTDGSEAEILLGQEYFNEDMIDGEIKTSLHSEAVTLLANNSNHRLYRDLYKWAATAEEKRAGDYYYQPTVISEHQKQWIKEDAYRLKKNYSDFLNETQLSNASLDRLRLQNALLECDAIPTVDYYRSNLQQTCTQSVTTFHYPADYCISGWK